VIVLEAEDRAPIAEIANGAATPAPANTRSATTVRTRVKRNLP